MSWRGKGIRLDMMKELGLNRMEDEEGTLMRKRHRRGKGGEEQKVRRRGRGL
jgi:hypothetical protein